MRRIIGAFLLGLLGEAAPAVEPFFASAVPAGAVVVQLRPTEAAPAATPLLVTFGFPFPRGSVDVADLDRVRVLRGGVEIPAHVSLMVPWRHRRDAGLDGTSVRIARIQLSLTPDAPFPAATAIEVQWGGVPRALDVPLLTDARIGWRQVTSGSFLAADGVFEPDVYALIPPDWLARGAFTARRAHPFAAGNADLRDDPVVNDAILQWPEFQEAERAQKNNFYTVINQDPGSAAAPNPYRSSAEPWLYDRAATMFRLYFRSGHFTALREAVRNTQFYAGRLSAQGFFDFGGVDGDTKYAYNECLAYAWWTTGDPTLPDLIDRVPDAQASFNHAWSPAQGFWTERHVGFKLLASVIAYEALGGATHRDAVDQILTDLRTHQDGAAGQVPAPFIDGGLYHTGSQHAGDWASAAYGASPWMSALVVDAAVRAFATAEDTETAQFVARLADFSAAAVVQTTAHSYPTSAPLALPRYAMLRDGADGQRNASDVEHALDVAALIGWGHWFREWSGGNGAPLRSVALDLYSTYDEGVNHWIRPAAPPVNTAYRSDPPRKWAWEHRVSDSLGFSLDPSDPDAVFANGFETP